MTHPAREIAQALQGLHATATLCANSFTTPQLKVEYQVAFSVGASLPWRLFEVHSPVPGKDKRCELRRMHCFRTSDDLERSIQERAKWKACDQQLVASYLVKFRRLSERLIEGEPSPSSRPNVDLSELRPARLKLRAQICITRPDLVVDLLNRSNKKGPPYGGPLEVSN
jgi:hypothetical protein